MSERIIAVIPIRSFQNGKIRLAPVLAPEARAAMLQQAARCVIEAARASGVVETILVVSPDPETLAWAGAVGPHVVALSQLNTLPGLIGAIDAGREWAVAAGADAMLSLFADLPFLAADDVRAMVGRGEPIVLGADRRGEGTNALLLRLDGASAGFRFAFGEGSLLRHLAEARRLGIAAAVHEATGIGFDLDTPDDWADYRAVTERAATCEASVA